MSEYVLMHHGVMGMKWGVRRYQNADGSLTAAGKKRFEKVSSNERLQKKQTKQALNVLKKKHKQFEKSKMNEYFAKKANKAKASFDDASYKKYMSLAKKHISDTKSLSTKINDISSGKMKAGRDFIVQTDYNAIVLPFFAAASRERRVIFK